VLDYKDMPIEHIVVDGSNIATEGRSLPSLKQLEEAVAELRRDHPNAEITVIVDATFAHRIDPSELSRFEQAALRGEYVHPPAGAIGRGDAFLLRVAEKVDGTVLSNDSFQEFHGEHPWLFERGRLLGATPVPGIGWIFSPRQPVRGPRSHQAVRETEQAKKRVTKAIAVATKEVVKPAGKSPVPAVGADGSRRRARSGAPSAAGTAPRTRDLEKPTPLAVNDPLAFISFIAEHRLGEQLEGEVESYTSHGAVVRVGDMRCYIPLANLGDPAPRSAREVLKRHERGQFVLTALDPQRRGAELALPGIAHVSGHPREETVAAEVRLAKPPRKREVPGAAGTEPVRRTAKRVAPDKSATSARPAKRASATSLGTKAARGKPPVAKAAAKAPVAKARAAKEIVEPAQARRAASKTAAKGTTAKKDAPKKASAKKTSARKTSASVSSAESSSKRATKKAPAKTAAKAIDVAAKAVARSSRSAHGAAKVAGKKVPAPTLLARRAVSAKKAAPGRAGDVKKSQNSPPATEGVKPAAKGRTSPRTTARTR
jgi:hypothetical protein